MVATVHGSALARSVITQYFSIYLISTKILKHYVTNNRLALAIANYMPGTDDESRFVRKTLVRQCNLMAVLLLRGLSNPVFNRTKVLEDAVRAGGL